MIGGDYRRGLKINLTTKITKDMKVWKIKTPGFVLFMSFVVKTY